MSKQSIQRKQESQDADGPQKSLGSELRQLRLAKEMTLRALSKASGRSLGYLSQIERDIVRPSLETLEQLARALGVDVNWFFPAEAGLDDREQGIVVRSQSRRRLSKSYSFDTEALGYEDFLLSGSLDQDLCMGMSRISPGGQTSRDPIVSTGHISGFVQRGSVVLWLEGQRFTLYEGDSYSHAMDRPHILLNEGEQIAEIVWALTPTNLNFGASDGQP